MPSRSFNRLLWIAMIVLLAVLVWRTRDTIEAIYAGVGSLTVEELSGGRTVVLRWRGRIQAPMEAELSAAFARTQDTARTYVLILSSPGGTLDHGGRVSRLLRRVAGTHELETRVEEGRRCASMCVPVFLQGERRTAAADAAFMFHEVSFREVLAKEDAEVPQSVTTSETDKLFDTYFKPAGVPQAWTDGVLAQMKGGNDVWKTATELVEESAGIVLEIRD